MVCLQDSLKFHGNMEPLMKTRMKHNYYLLSDFNCLMAYFLILTTLRSHLYIYN